MHVGLDYRPALVNREGIGRYVRELVRAMLSVDPEVRLELFGSTLAAPSFGPQALGLGSGRARLRRVRMPSKLLPALLAATGRGVDDLVGGPALYHHTSYSRLRVRRALEVACVHDCAYLDARGFVDQATARRMERVARELVAHASCVLVPSEHSRDEAVRLLDAAPERVALTPMGGDHLMRDGHVPTPAAPSERGPYLLSVSRVDRRKNHVRMLAAFERLVAEGLPHRWIVAGPPGYGGEDFERALERSPARERVERRRDVPESELVSLYAGADLFLFVSLTEGFGIPALEAMSVGTAVLAGDAGSLPEVCGDAACLVPPEDEQAIFEAARALLSDDERRADLVRRGEQRARQLSWRAAAEHTLEVYRRVLDGIPGSRGENDDGPP